ncbi:MAG: integration host factor subunit beta [Phycisphaeraceae bacterium]|nr:integration host factor subunit beta [Phycisphaeraceae bacterium]
MTTTSTKKEVIERLSQRTGLKRQDVRLFVQEFLEQLVLELKKGKRIEFRDFGIFEVRLRKGRQAQNPKTLVKVEVPTRRVVKFKPGRLLREAVERAPIQPGETISELKPAGKAKVSR